jgi:hypothetical protein
MVNKSTSSTINLRRWIAECDRALADAEYLVDRLGRVEGKAGAELSVLRVSIAALRARLDHLGEAETVTLEPDQAGR